MIAAVTYLIMWYIWQRRSPETDQLKFMLSFEMPPSKVVYEERQPLAAKLLALPAEPGTAYRGEPVDNPPFPYLMPNGDYRAAGDGELAAEYLPRFHQWMYGQHSAEGLIFCHQRMSVGGRERLLVATESRSWRALAGGASARDGIDITAMSARADTRFRPLVGNVRRRVRLALTSQQILRIYAGQVDPANDARFTIRYEIDDVPGTIEGVLQPDDSVTLKVLDGPAVNSWKPLP
jgi:hypothetical protein